MAKRIILLSIIILMLFSSTALAFHYNVKFDSAPFKSTYDNVPSIEAKLYNSGFEYKRCNYPPNCWPPPLAFAVKVSWQNPNDLTGDPNCWIPVYLGMAFYSYAGESIYNIYGNGQLRLLNPDSYFYLNCCYAPLNCENNYWKLDVWPAVNGDYKVEIFNLNFYEYNGPCYYCGDWWHYYKPCPWGPTVWTLSKTEIVKVRDTNPVNTKLFTELYYLSSHDQDTTLFGETMILNEEYDVICKIFTSLPPLDIPQQLIGYLVPEGEPTNTPITFTRWPTGDYTFPCNQNYPYRIYAYRADIDLAPIDLFPSVLPEEWQSTRKSLRCELYGLENQMDNDIAIHNTVMSHLQLDCVNDSTFCFIPANNEVIDFWLHYSPAIGLNELSDVRFKVWNNDQTIVFEENVIIRDIIYGPNQQDFPNIQIADSIRITWDGRVNEGDNAGHLANSLNSSFTARVELLEGGEVIMQSNEEIFNVAPLIDSVIVTHTPNFLPPGQGVDVNLYSIVRGKIDDSENSELNYLYFKPQGYSTNSVTIWNGESWEFWDRPSSLQRFYFEDNEIKTIDLYEWRSDIYGILDYKWFVIKDFREYRSTPPLVN